MAKSKEFSTSNSHLYYWIELVESNISIPKNQSDVTVKVFFKRDNNYKTYGSGEVTCKINGTTYTQDVVPSQAITSTAICLFTKTVTITHNSDGSKSVYVSASISMNTPLTSSEQGETFVLYKIPRGSVINSFSFKNGDISQGIDVNVTRYSTSYTHNVRLYYNGANGNIIIDLVANKSATFSSGTQHFDLNTSSNAWFLESVYNAMTNSSSGTFTLYINTWNGSTQVATWTSKQAKGTLPQSLVPSIENVTISRVDGDVPSEWGFYIQGKSKCILTAIGASSPYGASIKSYTFSGGGYSSTQTTNSFTTGFLNSSGTNNFTVTATDTRDRSVTKTFSEYPELSINVVPYFVPIIKTATSERCTSLGEKLDNDESTSFLSTLTIDYASCNGKNSVGVKVRYKKTTDLESDWSIYTEIPSNKICGNGNLVVDSAYDIQYLIYDYFGSFPTPTFDYVSSVEYWLHCKRGGKGAGFGKAATDDLLLDSAWKVNSDVGFTIDGVDILLLAHPVGSFYLSESSTNPSLLFGGTWGTVTPPYSSTYMWKRIT